MGYKNPLRKMTSAVIWAIMFIFPVSVSSQSKPLKQIYVGVSSVSMGNIIIYVTKEAKLFEKYGLYADPVAMRGSGESSKAMIGGSIQVAPIATLVVCRCRFRSCHPKLATYPAAVHAMIVKPEIKKSRISGQKVGVTTFGSSHRISGSSYSLEEGTSILTRCGSDSNRRDPERMRER
jgi:hypothetical protein